MHDGLAQVLGYVNTKSQAVEELLAAGRVAEAGKQMAELADAARSVYVDVREAILSLSPPVLPERGLAAALEEYAARFAESSKLAVRFHASPEARTCSGSEVAEVFSVAREALTNVRKHAHAQRVTIDLAVEGRNCCCASRTTASASTRSWPARAREVAAFRSGRDARASRIGRRPNRLAQPARRRLDVELRVPVTPGRSGDGFPRPDRQTVNPAHGAAPGGPIARTYPFGGRLKP